MKVIKPKESLLYRLSFGFMNIKLIDKLLLQLRYVSFE
jgi:hypothetical protein